MTYKQLNVEEIVEALNELQVSTSNERKFVLHTSIYGMWNFRFAIMGIKGLFKGKYYITQFKKTNLIYVSLFSKHGNWKVKIKGDNLDLYYGTVYKQRFNSIDKLYDYIDKLK